MIQPFSRSLRCVTVVVLLVLFFGSNSLAQTDPEVDKAKAKAFQLMKEQKYVDALPLLEKLSIDTPEDPQVFFYLGFALLGKVNVIGNEDEKKVLRVRSRKAFLRAKELGMQDPVINGLLQGMPEDGSEGPAASSNSEAEKVLKEGEAFYSRGKLDDALRSYEKALKLDPKLYEAALFSGDVYIAQNKFDRAEEFYQKAISINPDRETAYRYSATPLMKQKKYDAARERYIEAYITEPYNRFASGGLDQWSQVVGIDVGHPTIDIPEAEVDSNGNVKVDIGPDAKLGGRENGTFFWTLYAPARAKWRKDDFAKAYPKETQYRHSLAEEAAALRAVVSAVKAEKSIKKLDPSLEKLVKLDEQGLLESYILLARANDGIAADHPAYLKTNREKLRRYVKEYVVAPKPAEEVRQASRAGDQRSGSRIETEYDAAADKTTVKIGLEPITCVPGACIFYSIETSFAGRKAGGTIGRTTFALAIFTKSLKANTDQPLSMQVDDKVYDLGTMQYVTAESKDGLNVLIFGSSLKEQEVAAIAAGQRVEMRLGTLRFPLASANIQRISDFYKTAKGTQ